MIKTEDFAKVEVTSVAELRDWLTVHHAQEQSAWLVTWMKHAGDKYVSRWDVLDELLCFGWIDGIRRKLDDDRTMQLISPRKVQHWSKSYKDRVAALTEAGRMHAAGLRSVADGKANGLWHFMDDVDALILPEDLVAALRERPPALERFEAFSASSKRNMLRLIKLAKTPATRAKRIAQTADLAQRGETVPLT
ncbi:MAG: YdeI/OmpD-associated family protein [Rhodobacter sp.]|nr:YdeI/OmpD-associated family protein [Rhodobacter sp.]